MRAYCVKCRGTKEIPDENTTRIMNKRDIPMLQGKCLDCGKVCNTFLKREGGGTPRVRGKKPKKESAFGTALQKKLKERKKKKGLIELSLEKEGEEEVTPPPPPPPPDSPPPPVPPPPPSVPEE